MDENPYKSPTAEPESRSQNDVPWTLGIVVAITLAALPILIHVLVKLFAEWTL